VWTSSIGTRIGADGRSKRGGRGGRCISDCLNQRGERAGRKKIISPVKLNPLKGADGNVGRGSQDEKAKGS